jgi:hypothetical protein
VGKFPTTAPKGAAYPAFCPSGASPKSAGTARTTGAPREQVTNAVKRRETDRSSLDLRVERFAEP